MKTTYQKNTAGILKMFGVSAFISMLTSCSVITGIFKAGMGFGIFLVVLVVGSLIFVIARAGKK